MAKDREVEVRGNLLQKVEMLIKGILGELGPEALFDIMSQRVFPAVPWETQWMKEEIILAELDADSLSSIREQALNGLKVLCWGFLGNEAC